MKNPRISVVLPVYNAEKFISKSLSSILEQTYKNFELLVINDGSVDKTEQIVKNVKDKRIKIVKNEQNLGVTKSLNIGLKMSKGEYIARCDGDDVNNLNRFKTQIEFLDKNKDYVLVGSNFEIIDEKGKKIGQTILPETDEEIRKKIMIRNPISHPSVMYRRKVVLKIGGYRQIFNGAEDYDLWFRLLKVGRVYNLKEKLIKRRWHSDVVTKKAHFMIEMKALLVRLINTSSFI